ncbi:MAG: alginate lyase family protein, partial [Gammaproteobacteria bacterium]|nr:alginate lyase family protein [Gammaproteobacteria bacterium]
MNAESMMPTSKWRARVQRLTRMSVDELRVRSVQALRVRLERLAEHFSARTSADYAAAGTRLAFDRSAACLGVAGRDPAAIVWSLVRLDPQIGESFRRQSEQAEQGWLSLLGYERLQVGNPPRWHREALSGIEAPRRHWSRINHLDASLVGDHKVLWELNRHQYLLAPAFCWLLDRDARHFELVQTHLESWLGDNPPRRGVNWVSSLEVAYRAIVWCWLLWMLRQAPWRPGLRVRLLGALEAHGRHVERFLSTYYSPNTHLTGEALGLFYLGTLLADSAHVRRWRATGAAILEAALARQVHADGVYFEQASQYQRYTAEIYLHYLLLAEASGAPVADAAREALAKLMAVMRTTASAAGRMPLIGDDDGGMLLPLDHRAPDDVRALLLAGAVALERPELAPADASPSFAYWLCGIERTERMRAAPSRVPDWQDVYFACGGLAVLRDGWDRSCAVAVIDAGPHGALSCGHSHADALAMTLSIGDTELCIDRGTLTYCGPERNEFRSTLSHNTLEIDGRSSVVPAEPFKWLPGVPPRSTGRVCSSVHFSSFFGVAIGHVAGGRPSAHSRAVLHRRGAAWVIHDRGARPAARAGTLRWQLAPRLTAVSLEAGSLLVCDEAGRPVATIFLQGAAPVRIVTREVSPRLGQRVSAQCLELPVDSALEALTVIVPAAPQRPAVSFEVEARHDARAVRWTDAAGRHCVIAGAAQGPPLPDAPAVPAGLTWRIERAGA